MANRYWVGGTANWDGTAGTKWASSSGGLGGETVPTSADDVFFDGGSGVSTVTISAGNTGAKSINCTGFTGTLAGTAAITVSGSYTLVSGMTYTYSGTLTIDATSTIITGGKTFNGSVVINGSGITVTLGSSLLVLNTRSITLTQGTFDLNGFSASTGFFSSSNSNTRSIVFGTQTISLTRNAVNTNILDMSVATNFTWSGTSGGFIRTQVSSSNANFGTTGGSVSNAPNLQVTSGIQSFSCLSGSYFKDVNVSLGTPAVIGMTYNACGNLTTGSNGNYVSVIPTFLASGTISSGGRTLGSVTLNGSGSTVTLSGNLTLNTGSSFTLTQGTLDLANFTLSTPIFNSNSANTRSIAFGSGNIALTSTSAGTTILSMSNATNFSWTGTGGFTRNQSATSTITFGVTGGTTSNAPNLTVNAGASSLVLTDQSYFNNLIFTGSTCFVSGNGGLDTELGICGNLTLGSGTYTAVRPAFIDSGTMTSNGRQLGAFYINGAGITVTLADNLNVGTNSVTLTQGTFSAANFNVTALSFISNNTNTRTVNMGSGTWTLSSAGTAWNAATSTNLTVNPSSSTIRLSASGPFLTFYGGGKTYYNLVLDGTDSLGIYGSNTFNNITNTYTPFTLLLEAGTTQTVSNFSFTGVFGFISNIRSTSAGVQATLSKTSGTINTQYLSIQDVAATGGANWYVFNGVNQGNNSGWIFNNNNGFGLLLIP